MSWQLTVIPFRHSVGVANENIVERANNVGTPFDYHLHGACVIPDSSLLICDRLK